MGKYAILAFGGMVGEKWGLVLGEGRNDEGNLECANILWKNHQGMKESFWSTSDAHDRMRWLPTPRLVY